MKTQSLRTPSVDLQKVAEAELNENPKRLQTDLDELKLWLSKQCHINGRTDDQFLVAFLRGCKFSLERSKEKLDMFYTIRSAIPEFFANRSIEDKRLQDVMSLGLTLPLPSVETNSAPRILLVRQGMYDPNQLSISDVIKVTYMITDLLLWEDDHSTISGQTVIVDLKGFSMAHVTQCSAVLIKKMTSAIQEAYPIRQKGIHFINAPTVFDALYKIFYNFMSKKLKKRIFLHDSIESLHKHIPKRLLPKEYGGDAGPIQSIANEWKEKLMAANEWFLEDSQYKTDESKRLGAAKNGDLLFGTDGSFRKLEFD